jgi:hypothetical protein
LYQCLLRLCLFCAVFLRSWLITEPGFNGGTFFKVTWGGRNFPGGEPAVKSSSGLGLVRRRQFAWLITWHPTMPRHGRCRRDRRSVPRCHRGVAGGVRAVRLRFCASPAGRALTAGQLSSSAKWVGRLRSSHQQHCPPRQPFGDGNGTSSASHLGVCYSFISVGR